MNDLQVIEYNNQRILTTQQLAEIYETDVDNIKNNFNRNKDKFIENKHYYFLQGKELDQFKSCVTNSYPVSKYTRNLYLWTERGANRHCKILDTDKAWEQFDYLEDTYFKVKEIINTQPQVQIPFKEQVECVDIIAKSLKVNDASKILMYSTLYKDYNLPTNFLPKYELNDNREMKSATELLKRFDLQINTINFNKLMVQSGYLEEKTRNSTKEKDKIKKYKALTEKGLKYGENAVSPHNQREVQPLYYSDTFKELVELISEKAGVLA